jgi:hypothetical protein
MCCHVSPYTFLLTKSGTSGDESLPRRPIRLDHSIVPAIRQILHGAPDVLGRAPLLLRRRRARIRPNPSLPGDPEVVRRHAQRRVTAHQEEAAQPVLGRALLREL